MSSQSICPMTRCAAALIACLGAAAGCGEAGPERPNEAPPADAAPAPSPANTTARIPVAGAAPVGGSSISSPADSEGESDPARVENDESGSEGGDGSEETDEGIERLPTDASPPSVAESSSLAALSDQPLTQLTPSESVSLCEALAAVDRAIFRLDRIRELDCLWTAIEADSPATCTEQFETCLAAEAPPSDPELADMARHASDLANPEFCTDVSFGDACSAPAGAYQACYVDDAKLLDALIQAPLETYSCALAGDEQALDAADDRLDDLLGSLEDPESCLALPADCY